MTLLGDIMKIKQVLNELYNKFTDNSTFKNSSIPIPIFFHAFLYLIKLYLLNLPEDNDNSLKISFIVVNLLVKDHPEETKFYSIPKLICTMD